MSNKSSEDETLQRNKNRRSFLIATGAGIATVAAPVTNALASSGDSSTDSWDYKTDIVCVGSGAAAMTAAVTPAMPGPK